MDKRKFLKTAFVATFATADITSNATRGSDANSSQVQKRKLKHWVWVDPRAEDTEDDLKVLYKSWLDAGIRGIFFEADSEKHFRIAKMYRMEAHRWMWTMNRGEKELLATHPEWYAVNRKGESCASKPPYVNYYRWLCPTRPEVHQYLEQSVRQILSKTYTDGIHLDYVRFCDVILPVNLWEKYGIDQTRELPEYDYCYCDACVKEFEALSGVNIRSVQYPDQNLSWRKFRYDRITSIVNRLSAVAKEYKKPITAAVFPTPEVAKRIVRQDWVNWKLDGVCPMIYHGFYKEQVGWIGDAVSEGVNSLHGNFPLYAGLYLPDFKDNEEVRLGINLALENGAAGISFFGKMTPGILQILSSVR